ncbi:hypothetical protein L7F22_016112 [Adiantum nelumboides]|nr:hypothetical protein [Adiantum nelumboides]
MNMAQLMENAEVADDLIQGKPDEDGFKTRRKEPQGKQFSAKGNVTSRLTVPPFKKKPFAGSKPFAGNMPFNTGNRLNAENQRFRPPFLGQRQGFKRHFTGKTIEERKALRDAKKCYICEGHFANECPQRNSQNKDDKSDRKGKKPKPSAGLVPDLVGDQQNVDVTELCRAWGKVRDQGVLVFFDPRARANFIPVVSASAISSVIKNHLSAYLVFAKEVHEVESNLSKLDKDRAAFLNAFSDCFSDSLPDELPPEGAEDQRIDVFPGSSPPNRPPYRVKCSTSERDYESVQKKDGSWRMCIDYRALNKNTIKNRFPIPRLDDILDRLQGGLMFSRIDLKSGFHQIRIRPEDVHKTSFRTTFGLYEFLVMPFGLTNAPATFNRMMDRIFRPHRNYVGTFFDDMIVFSKSEEEHRDYLTAVFNELRKNRLLINAKKSEFFLEEIHFLGHIVSKSGIRMDPAKVEANKSWPDLKTVHDIRSFLGLCSYYRRFIRHFAEIASPLHALTHKGVTFKWTTKEITAFKHSKEKLTSDPVIILPDLLKPFVVQCDACGNSLGVVLMQDDRVVAYESRVFSDRERTLQIYEKEMLAVMHAIYCWKHSLLGADFIVQTDHQTLRYMRWANFLSMFHFQIVHVEGKKNVVADALSCKPQVSAVSISYHNDKSPSR